MRRFDYCRDPLFLLGCAAYSLNRWLIKPHLGAGFFHSHFNDVWLIPCALPPLLWLHRRCGLRSHNLPPQPLEIISHLVLWSVFFEWLGPKIVAHAVGDPWDVLAYMIGGLVAAAWWGRDRWYSKAVAR